MTILALALVCLLGAMPATAQPVESRHYNHWIFGANCHIAWDTDDVLSNQPNNTNINVREGVATYSDPLTGELLLYTDGINAWDASGTLVNTLGVMAGDPSSLNSGVIVPVPGSSGDLFVISNPDDHGVMQITRFNRNGNSFTQVGAPQNIVGTESTVEGLQVALHSNKQDFWLIGKNDDSLVVVPITSSGAGTAVTYSDTDLGTDVLGVGIPIYTTIVVNNKSTQIASNATNTGEIILFDFDPATGVVSNARQIANLGTWSYGAVFSPSDRYLYVTLYSTRVIVRIDLQNADALETIGTSTGHLNLGQIASARDGKLYYTGDSSTSLGVIANPDAPLVADVGWNDVGWPLASGCTGQLGLPTALPTHIEPPGVNVPTVDPLITSDTTPTITGGINPNPGDVLTVEVNGKTYTQGDGNLSVNGTTWSLQIPAGDALNDNVYDVKATVTPTIGNPAVDLTTDELVIDTQAPSVPTVDPQVTSDTTPTITGSATVGTGETLYVDVNGKTYTEGDGNLTRNGTSWSLTIPGPDALSDGVYDVIASVKDAAGNKTNDTTSDELTIDTTNPTIPTVNSQVTNDNTPTITGTATVGSGEALTVTVNGKTYSVGDGNLSLNGTNWTLTIPTGDEIPDNTYDVMAKVTDLAGNVSGDGTRAELTVDTLSPAVPTVVSQITSDSTPIISGTATVGNGETLSVTVNGTTYDGIIPNGTTWTLQIPDNLAIPDGTYDVVAEVRDLAGNTSTDLTSGELIVDTTAPTAPTVNPQVTSDTTPTITGTATVGSGETLTVEVDGDTYTEGDGNLTRVGSDWTLKIPSGDALNDGTYDVTAVVTDAAGNATKDPTDGELRIDTQLPSVPTVDSQITNDNTPAITGSATVGADERLTVEVNGVVYNLGDGNLSIDGTTWTLVIPNANALPDAIYDVKATVTDAAGNASSDATTDELVVDTQVPGVPTVDSQTTSDTTPTITGSATVGADESFTVSVNGKSYALGDGDLTLSGTTWELTIPDNDALVDGVYDVKATVTDLAGNNTSDTTSDELTIDTTPPVVPTVNTLVTNDTTPAITGTATVGGGEILTVEVSGKTYTAGDGNLVLTGTNWTLTIPDPDALADGVYDVKATVTDAAANATSDTTTDELTIDTTAPVVPTVNSQTTNDTTPLVTGTATVGTGESLSVTINGKTYTVGDGKLTLSGTSWTVAIPDSDALADGVYDVKATVTDAAGNATSDTTTDELRIDTAGPPVPTVDVLVTNDKTPTVTGKATVGAGETLIVEVNGKTYNLGDGNLTLSGTDWSLAIPDADALDDDVYDVKATVIDAAGNATSDTTIDELTIDTSAPDVPTVDSLVTEDTTPTLTGTASVGEGETLTVTVNGKTYDTDGGDLTRDGTNWTLVIPDADALPNGTYDVKATVTDPAGNATNDATTDELQIVAPTCVDGEQNGSETDVDCGGTECGKCNDGQTCDAASDCKSGNCLQSGHCGSTCDDGIKNGDETDVDCGGSCGACDDGKQCSVNSDCKSNDCVNGACGPTYCPDAPNPDDCDNDGLPNKIEDSNANGKKDPGETDWNNPDTDGDKMLDGDEDKNHNGKVDKGETDPRIANDITLAGGATKGCSVSTTPASSPAMSLLLLLALLFLTTIRRQQASRRD